MRRDSYLDIDKGHFVSQEERTRLVGSINKLRYLLLELFSMLDLGLFILGLQVAIEPGDNMTVDLCDSMNSNHRLSASGCQSYMIRP